MAASVANFFWSLPPLSDKNPEWPLRVIMPYQFLAVKRTPPRRRESAGRSLFAGGDFYRAPAAGGGH